MRENPDRRVRVAYIVESFAVGGTELNAVRTAEALDPGRVELLVIYLADRGPLRGRYERLGVPMTHLPIGRLHSMRTALQGWRLAMMLRREGVDVVHSHDIYSNIFVAPWVRMLTTCSLILSRRWVAAARAELAWVNRWSSVFAHRLLINNGGVAELVRRTEGIPAAKIVVLPNFLDAHAFETAGADAREAQHRDWGVPPGAFTVGIVARLSPEKNHPLIFNAMALLEARFHLVVVGDGPAREALRDLAVSLGIAPRVHFAGETLMTRNVQQFFDVSVLCSLTEGFPNALIEAMAAARPVVATPVGGVVEALEDGVTGLLVPVDDPLPLAQALRRLEAQPQWRARLGEAGRVSAGARFRREPVIERLMILYGQLAAARRRGDFRRYA